MVVDDSGLLRLVAEVPIHEDTLFWILTLGVTRDLHISTPDIIDLVDVLVRRAALLHSAGTGPLPDYSALKRFVITYLITLSSVHLIINLWLRMLHVGPRAVNNHHNHFTALFPGPPG